MSPIIGIMASQNYPRVTNSYESIATVTVGAGGASSISFSSIPSTYTHLQIRGILRESDTNTGAGALWMQVNGDTGSNYAWHRAWGNGSTATAGAGSSTTWSLVGINSRSGNGSNIFGATIIDLLDYSLTTKYKTFRALSGEEANSSNGYSGIHSGLWLNTNAISSITLYPSATYSWTQYSQLALYGVKA
jgi:hypothetical protein